MYLRRPVWDSGISPPELLTFLETQPPARAIDLGCGTGTNVITLAQKGWRVTGVDFVPRAVEIARHKAQQAGVKVDLRVGDVTQLDGIVGPFDLALDLGCFHSLSEKGKGEYLRQLTRILAPGGIWFLYAFLASMRTTPGLSPENFEQILACFRLVSYQDGVDRKNRPSSYFLFSKI